MELKIGARALSKILRHEASVRPGNEIVGLLWIDARGVIKRYEKLHNRTRARDSFVVNHREEARKRLKAVQGGCQPVLVHSHPSGCHWPSAGDRKLAGKHWLGVPYAILAKGSIHFFELHPDRKRFRRLYEDNTESPWFQEEYELTDWEWSHRKLDSDRIAA